MNKVIHLQIQEGELLPRGEILKESVQWKDIDNFTVVDRNVKNGRDYHSLDWENRALDLDDLVAPESHLLTGKTHQYHVEISRWKTLTNIFFNRCEIQTHRYSLTPGDQSDAI